MRWLVDSNVVIDALAGLPHAVNVFKEARIRPGIQVVFSAITRIEVLGFPNLTEQEETAARLLLGQFDEIAVTSAVVERTIEIRKSTRIKIPDAIIAASALSSQATVVTRNIGDFQGVRGLEALHPDNV